MRKLIGIAGLMMMVSCSNPEIDIHGPTEGQTYITEAYIWIDATITDPDGIKRVTYKIYTNTYDFFPVGAPTTYELDDSQSMQAFQSGYEVVITIEAEDMNGNVGTKKVGVIHS
jgi:hypothetical protein